MSQTKSVAEVYKSVVSDVVDGVREAFQEEGLDEQVLQELKQLWENKLKLSKALDGLLTDTTSSTISISTNRMPPPAHSHHQSRLHPHQQLIINNNNNNSNNNNNNINSSNVTSLGSVLNLGSNQLAHHLTGNQPTSHSLNPVILQHLNNLSTLVPRGSNNNNRPILIQPHLGGASFIQSQNNIIFGLSDQPIATNATPQNGVSIDNASSQNIVQLDGVDDSSSEDEDDDNKHDDDNEDANETNVQTEEVDDEPLNSGDDDPSDDDAQDLFDADNVVVCQFDKINRSKAKWKFHLKDGIMNLTGKDYVFQKAVGDAEF